MRLSLLIPSLLFAFTGSVVPEPMSNADHTCNETIAVAKHKLVNEPVKYEFKYQTMCGLLPCTKTKIEVRTDAKMKTIWEEVDKLTCCPGYTETPDRKCAPICLKSCQNGNCIRPGICKCNPEPTETSPGFVGSTCSRFTCLAVDRWGSKCDRECNCPQNSYCSASTGKCLCRTGWRGANCTEECDSSMNCEGVELPPIIEPEANVFDNEIIGPSQRLVASQSRSMLGGSELETEDSLGARSVASLVATHMGINLFLIILTSVLIAAVYWYKKRLNQIKNELYYAAYSSSPPSSGGDSNYSTSIRGDVTMQRQRMPTPLEGEFLSKNLNFASATRSILLKDSVDSKNPECRDKHVLDPKVESRLMSSQKSSQQNIYSDIDSSFSDKSMSVASRRPDLPTMGNIPEDRMLNVSVSREREEEHQYQVPRSPTLRPDLCIDLHGSRQRDPLMSPEDIYAFNDNIYEEIKPRSPEKH